MKSAKNSLRDVFVNRLEGEAESAKPVTRPANLHYLVQTKNEIIESSIEAMK
jgi:hypothetical protein